MDRPSSPGYYTPKPGPVRIYTTPEPEPPPRICGLTKEDILSGFFQAQFNTYHIQIRTPEEFYNEVVETAENSLTRARFFELLTQRRDANLSELHRRYKSLGSRAIGHPRFFGNVNKSQKWRKTIRMFRTGTCIAFVEMMEAMLPGAFKDHYFPGWAIWEWFDTVPVDPTKPGKPSYPAEPSEYMQATAERFKIVPETEELPWINLEPDKPSWTNPEPGEHSSINPEPKEPWWINQDPDEPSRIVPETEEPPSINPETEEPPSINPETDEPSYISPGVEGPLWITPGPEEPSWITPEPDVPFWITPEPDEPSLIYPEPDEPSSINPEPDEPSSLNPKTDSWQMAEPSPSPPPPNSPRMGWSSCSGTLDSRTGSCRSSHTGDLKRSNRRRNSDDRKTAEARCSNTFAVKPAGSSAETANKTATEVRAASGINTEPANGEIRGDGEKRRRSFEEHYARVTKIRKR